MAAIPSHDAALHVFAAMPMAPSRDTTRSATPEVASQRLLQGQREMLIRHGGETCRLRHTRNDKLILTK